ncbi:MAG: 23S rRNA (uracil(1939)-C(5))-methyltransferase RlmD [Steroidobacteraceae bacterium]|nr:23S rRNA (uracil(1939)-C(5))-methyltransferase RlmD [Nevskiaceae bacterium]MCP5339653.1 23S rRNA (uracil(1939)-C(5))-methyltransferase RlmD [Nevskiaceae bacterium]
MSSRKALPRAEPETGTVAGLNHDGAGVVRGAKAAFVPGALPGEEVRFVRRRRHRQHDDAELLEVLRPSADRVEPRCAHFGVCGGCALQHMAPDAQLAAKQGELAEALQRIGQVTPDEWFAPLAGPRWAYRRRARLGARYVIQRERVLVGFRERQKPYVAALARCEILAAPVGTLIEPLGQLLTGMAAREAIPQIEVAVGDAATALVFRVLAALPPGDLEALRGFERQHGVHVFLQPGGLDTVQPLTPPGPRLTYSLPEFGLELEFQPADFIQVNGELNRALVERALQLLDCGPGDRVLDLFCGLGNFTLPIARRGATVLGVEGDAGLVARARQNAERAGLGGASFVAANLAQPEAATAAWLAGPWTHVLLDPPRAGALEMLPAAAALRPGRIVYVSCHPGSLARDLGILCGEHGYRLRGAGVVDMFPHTTHVESIAVLERPARRGRA